MRASEVVAARLVGAYRRGMGLIVVDLDGTLVDSRGGVSDRHRAAIGRAQAAGWQVIVATGRTWSECRGLLDAAGIDGAIVTASGATLSTHPGGRTLERVELPADIAVEATRCLIEHACGVLALLDPDDSTHEYVHVGPHPLHPVSLWWHEHHGHTVAQCASPADLPSHGVLLRIAAVADAADLAAPLRDLDRRLPASARAWHWEAVTDPGEGHAPVDLLEVFARNSCKWTMVERWCAREGLDLGNVVALGDGLNDVELIRRAPLGIAMGNARRQVRDVADHVVPSNDEHGVAVAIESLLEGRLGVPG